MSQFNARFHASWHSTPNARFLAKFRAQLIRVETVTGAEMDKPTSRPAGRCVIVHSSRLVAEDLRQLLLAEGASEVVMAKDRSSVTAQADAIAFVEGSHANLTDDGCVRAWRSMGTPVVALNGAPSSQIALDGIYKLEQPFRTEDVVDLLKSLKVF